jgi:hypothetical protein
MKKPILGWAFSMVAGLNRWPAFNEAIAETTFFVAPHVGLCNIRAIKPCPDAFAQPPQCQNRNLQNKCCLIVPSFFSASAH